MSSGIGKGYLVIADISGFTPFLAEAELDHSQAILSDIFTLIIQKWTPRLTIAEIEGDAVFAYATDEQLPRGETLLEMIEATYVDFRDKQKSGQRMATCKCRACQMIPSLDLKFMTHHGDFVFQDVGGSRKPLGSSVNLLHRLLKNSVGEKTGWRGYALFTAESLRQMDVHPLNIYEQTESYEHLGDVQTFSVNLDERYKELTEERRHFLQPDDADVVLTNEYPVPPAVLWEWLNDPKRRLQWMVNSGWHVDGRPSGRTSRGATNHCSNSGFLERILDWRPFSYYTVEFSRKPIRMKATSQLKEIATGTRLVWCARFSNSLPGWLRRPLCRLFVAKGPKIPMGFERLGLKLREEQALLTKPS